MRQKAGLNRVILKTRMASALLKRMFDYKASEVIEINPAYHFTDLQCVRHHRCQLAQLGERIRVRGLLAMRRTRTWPRPATYWRRGLALQARRGAFGLPTPMTREMLLGMRNSASPDVSGNADISP